MKYIILVLSLLFISISLYAFDIENRTMFEKSNKLSIKIDYPFLKGNSKAAQKINEDITNALIDSVKEFKEICKDNEMAGVTFSFESLDKNNISLNTNNIFSCVIHVMSYTGGAHPNCDFYTFNYIIKDDVATSVDLKNIVDLNKLSNYMVPIINKEKKDRIEEGFEELKTIDLDTFDEFTLDPFGLNVIFPQYAIGSYAEGEYIFPIYWDNIIQIVNNDTILEYINNKALHNNIDGIIKLSDSSSVPSNAKVIMNLIWIPTNKPMKVLESRTYSLEKGDRSLNYKNSYDWTDKSDKNEYEVTSELYFDNVLAYKNSDVMPLTSQGWPKDVEINLENIYSKEIQDNNFATIPYIRLKGKLVGNTDDYFEEGTMCEFRIINNKNKIVKKVFISIDLIPYMFDIAFDNKDLNDDLYKLKIIIVKDKKTLYESNLYNFSRKDWSLPEKITLIKK